LHDRTNPERWCSLACLPFSQQNPHKTQKTNIVNIFHPFLSYIWFEIERNDVSVLLEFSSLKQRWLNEMRSKRIPSDVSVYWLLFFRSVISSLCFSPWKHHDKIEMMI
jgi:hypothetical protein